MKRIFLLIFSGILFFGIGLWVWDIQRTHPPSQEDIARAQFFSNKIKVHLLNLYELENDFYRRTYRFTSDMDELYVANHPLDPDEYIYGFLPDRHKPDIKTLIQKGQAVKVDLDNIPKAVKEACPDCHVPRTGYKALAYGYVDLGGKQQLVIWTIDDSHHLTNPIGVPSLDSKPVGKSQ